MARPPKKGMKYYPKDTDFLRHKNVAFLRDKKGAAAVLLVESLWAMMYEEGGPIELDDATIAAASTESTVSESEVLEVVEFAISKAKLLIKDGDLLYSNGVKERIDQVNSEKLRKKKSYSRKNPGETLEESDDTTGELGESSEELQQNCASERRNPETVSLSLSFLNNNKGTEFPNFTFSDNAKRTILKVHGPGAADFYEIFCNDLLRTRQIGLPKDPNFSFDSYGKNKIREDRTAKKNFFHPNHKRAA